MTSISPAVNLFINLAKSQSVVNRRFNSGLVGLGFSEFVIMFHMSQAEGMKLRRIDLASKLGLTASGITRLLAPMEKVGLIKREVSTLDARASLVTLTASGKRQVTESLDELERLADDILPTHDPVKLNELSELLANIAMRSR